MPGTLANVPASLPPEIASAACRQMLQGNAESAHLHLESVKRQLLREGSDFAE